MFGSTQFNASKLKAQLKMAIGRFEMLKNKKSALLKQNMRHVATMLAEEHPQEEKAKIRAEALIRDDNCIEALEILQLHCELLHERVKLIELSNECPPDLLSVVGTLLWASYRVEIPELVLIRKQFVSKFGKSFKERIMTNTNGCLNERVVTKLSIDPPATILIQAYLEKICELYEVDWKPSQQVSLPDCTNNNEMIQPLQPPTGYSIRAGQGSGTIAIPTNKQIDDSYRHESKSLPPSNKSTGNTNNRNVGTSSDDFATGFGSNDNERSGSIMSFFRRSSITNDSRYYKSKRGGPMPKAFTGTSTRIMDVSDESCRGVPSSTTTTGSTRNTNNDNTNAPEQTNISLPSKHNNDVGGVMKCIAQVVLPPPSAPPGSVRSMNPHNQYYNFVDNERNCIDSVPSSSKYHFDENDRINQDDNYDDNYNNNVDDHRDDVEDSHFPRSTSSMPLRRGNHHNNNAASNGGETYGPSIEYADLAARFDQLTR